MGQLTLNGFRREPKNILSRSQSGSPQTMSGLDALATHTNEVLVDGGRVAVLLPCLRSGGRRVGKRPIRRTGCRLKTGGNDLSTKSRRVYKGEMPAFLFVIGLFALSLMSSGVQANKVKVFPSAGKSGNTCPQGSQDVGSGDCRRVTPRYRLFRSDGLGVRTCPYGSTYVGNGYCRSN